MSYFDFKQFRIYQDRCAMKVGTDGVLLGAWAQVAPGENILDIGTGTGLIAIMLAQRADINVTGIEIDAEAASQAFQNAENSPYSQRIHIQQADLKDFQSDTLFDNIVSNPPFYKEAVLPPNSNRSTARHSQGLPFETLVKEAKRLLKPNGVFQVILPYTESSHFIGLCALQSMSLLRQTNICTKEGKMFKRTLLCFVNQIEATQPTRNTLCLSDAQNGRSEAYNKLTQDFYIK